MFVWALGFSFFTNFNVLKTQNRKQNKTNKKTTVPVHNLKLTKKSCLTKLVNFTVASILQV